MPLKKLFCPICKDSTFFCPTQNNPPYYEKSQKILEKTRYADKKRQLSKMYIIRVDIYVIAKVYLQLEYTLAKIFLARYTLANFLAKVYSS